LYEIKINEVMQAGMKNWTAFNPCLKYGKRQIRKCTKESYLAITLQSYVGMGDVI